MGKTERAMGKTDRAIKLKELDAQLRDLDLETADHYRRQVVRIRDAREAIKAISDAEKEGDQPTP